MTCLDFENRLNDFFDRRQRELPEELARHATHCAVCREKLSCLNQLHDAIASWQASLPTTPLADAVLQQLRIEQGDSSKGLAIQTTRPTARESHPPSHRHSPFHRWSALLFAALAIVIAIGIGWRVSSNISFTVRQSPSPNPVAVTPTPRPETVVPLNPAGDRQLDVLLHDARDAYAALASHAWQQVSTADVLLPTGDVPNLFERESSADEVSESFSRPLAPLGRELREAVDSWFQQIFSNQDPAT
ncbi:MAG: hypothetical protein FD138_4045 [Planctomycetota bacterium]|nr:MAG: hypothetical protein FD138_4045 [Planctomycetota bacterium]